MLWRREKTLAPAENQTPLPSAYSPLYRLCYYEVIQVVPLYLYLNKNVTFLWFTLSAQLQIYSHCIPVSEERSLGKHHQVAGQGHGRALEEIRGRWGKTL
jgi:hypothetical protein